MRYVPRLAAIDSGRAIPKSGGRDFLGNSVPSCRGVDRGAIESVSCLRTKATMHNFVPFDQQQ
jgi:hypothetical protein